MSPSGEPEQPSWSRLPVRPERLPKGWIAELAVGPLQLPLGAGVNFVQRLLDKYRRVAKSSAGLPAFSQGRANGLEDFVDI